MESHTRMWRDLRDGKFRSYKYMKVLSVFLILHGNLAKNQIEREGLLLVFYVVLSLTSS